MHDCDLITSRLDDDSILCPILHQELELDRQGPHGLSLLPCCCNLLVRPLGVGRLHGELMNAESKSFHRARVLLQISIFLSRPCDNRSVRFSQSLAS
jgi:hypothetical protein